MRMLLGGARAAATTEAGLAYGDRLFGTSAGPGIRLAVDALRGAVPDATAVAVLTTYREALRQGILAHPTGLPSRQ